MRDRAKPRQRLNTSGNTIQNTHTYRGERTHRPAGWFELLMLHKHNTSVTTHRCNYRLCCVFLCTHFMSQHTHVQIHAHLLPAGCCTTKKNILIHQFRGDEIKEGGFFLLLLLLLGFSYFCVTFTPFRSNPRAATRCHSSELNLEITTRTFHGDSRPKSFPDV